MAAAKKKKATSKKTAKKKVAKKATAKKATVKKTAKKKVVKKVAKKAVKKTVKKAAKSTPAKKLKVGKKPFTKSEIMSAVAEMSGIAKKEAVAVVDALASVIGAHVAKTGPGMVSVPGLLKIKVAKKPATKARKGINPFTGEPTTFKAKPASRKVKVLPLKALKDMAAK